MIGFLIGSRAVTYLNYKPNTWGAFLIGQIQNFEEFEFIVGSP